MKRRYIIAFFTLSGICILFMSNSIGRALIGFGNTGAPGESAGCFLSNCHVDTQVFGNQTIIQVFEAGTENEITNYTPGQVYDLRIQILTSQPAEGYGFQVVALLQSDLSDVAGFINPSEGVGIRTAVNTGRQYAEHTERSENSSFEVQWLAPPINSGTVQFWASGNAVDASGSPSGDDPDNASLIIPEAGTVAIRAANKLQVNLNIVPNPVHEILRLEIESPETGLFDLDILNAVGQEMCRDRVSLTRGQNVYQQDALLLNPGLYLIRIKKGHRFLTATFIKN